MFVIEINFCDGVGGVMEIIEIKMRGRVLYLLFFLVLLVVVSCVRFSGGILGWDPVHTTCIPDEMMMRL